MSRVCLSRVCLSRVGYGTNHNCLGQSFLSFSGIYILFVNSSRFTAYLFFYFRSVKIWSVDEKSYVETMYGHQDRVTAIDAGTRERCVTAGGRDRTVRVWKIVEVRFGLCL